MGNIYRLSEHYAVYRIQKKITIIYDILAELQEQGKKVILCKVPAHIGIKGNEANKAAKQAINLPGITPTRLPYTEYYFMIRNSKGSGKITLAC